MNCSGYKEKIQSYLEGDLPGKQAEKFKAHMRQCGACRNEYEDYRMMMKCMGSLELQKCPAQVVDDVYREIESRNKDHKVKNGFLSLLDFPSLTMRQAAAVGMAAVLLLTLIIAFPGIKDHYFTNPQYSDEEIQQGVNQVKMLLGYIKHLNRKTQEKIEREVMDEGIAHSLNNSVESLENYILDNNGG